jgi:hypothetical protein
MTTPISPFDEALLWEPPPAKAKEAATAEITSTEIIFFIKFLQK